MPTTTSFPSQSTYLPVVTAIVGLGGLVNGVRHFTETEAPSTLYGGPINLKTSTSDSNKTTSTSFREWQLAYVSAYGTRNIATGLSIIALSAYWRYSPSCQISAVSQAVKHCVGIVILSGAVVPIADVAIVQRAKSEPGLTDAERKVGVQAGFAHGMRALVWLVVGTVCLWK